MSKIFLMFASIFGALAVALGAFGAHALKGFLEASQRTETYETAVRYQFYHALALLFVGLWVLYKPHAYLNYAGYGFIAGTLIFSGSLYLLCFSGIKWLGAITPIGGVAFILGWIFLMLAAYEI